MSTELATERLRLRLWQLADAERLHNLWAERDPRSLHVIRLCGRTGGAEPGVTSADDGRGSVGDLQFGQNVRHVVAYRFPLSASCPAMAELDRPAAIRSRMSCSGVERPGNAGTAFRESLRKKVGLRNVCFLGSSLRFLSESGPGAGGWLLRGGGRSPGPCAARCSAARRGSEVLGYDDARSADHAWGPRLIIFVDHEEVGLVRRAIDAGLPQAYRGHQIRFFAWQDRTVRHHVEVVTVADWATRTTWCVTRQTAAGSLARPPSTAAAPGDGWCGVPRRRRSTV
jgi:hypothetical protein